MHTKSLKLLNTVVFFVAVGNMNIIFLRRKVSFYIQINEKQTTLNVCIYMCVDFLSTRVSFETLLSVLFSVLLLAFLL